jgi:hypothetical protein
MHIFQKGTSMKSFQQWLVENDADHAETLRQTGFWGKQGAGAILIDQDRFWSHILGAHGAAQ